LLSRFTEVHDRPCGCCLVLTICCICPCQPVLAAVLSAICFYPPFMYCICYHHSLQFPMSMLPPLMLLVSFSSYLAMLCHHMTNADEPPLLPLVDCCLLLHLSCHLLGRHHSSFAKAKSPLAALCQGVSQPPLLILAFSPHWFALLLLTALCHCVAGVDATSHCSSCHLPQPPLHNFLLFLLQPCQPPLTGLRRGATNHDDAIPTVAAS